VIEYEFSVVGNATTFAPNLYSGRVVLETAADNFGAEIEALSSIEAKNCALRYAAQCGVPDPCLNGLVQAPYAVNKDGIPLDEVRGPNGETLPYTHQDMQVSRYQVAVPVHRRLI
jgi:hypothetical protein